MNSKGVRADAPEGAYARAERRGTPPAHRGCLVWFTALPNAISRVEKHEGTLVSYQTLHVRSVWNLTAVLSLEDGRECSILQRSLNPEPALYPGHTTTVYTYQGKASLSPAGFEYHQQLTQLAVLLLIAGLVTLGVACGKITAGRQPRSPLS